MKFPDLVTNEKDVDNVENYLNVKFQTKVFTRYPENAKKNLIFGHKIAYNKKIGFFGKNRALSLFYPYNGLTSGAKAKKSLEHFSRKTLN